MKLTLSYTCVTDKERITSEHLEIDPSCRAVERGIEVVSYTNEKERTTSSEHGYRDMHGRERTGTEIKMHGKERS